MAFLDASAATYLVARTAAERPLRWPPASPACCAEAGGVKDCQKGREAVALAA